jgi:hypothetical protein
MIFYRRLFRLILEQNTMVSKVFKTIIHKFDSVTDSTGTMFFPVGRIKTNGSLNQCHLMCPEVKIHLPFHAWRQDTMGDHNLYQAQLLLNDPPPVFSSVVDFVYPKTSHRILAY